MHLKWFSSFNSLRGLAQQDKQAAESIIKQELQSPEETQKRIQPQHHLEATRPKTKDGLREFVLQPRHSVKARTPETPKPQLQQVEETRPPTRKGLREFVLQPHHSTKPLPRNESKAAPLTADNVIWPFLNPVDADGEDDVGMERQMETLLKEKRIQTMPPSPPITSKVVFSPALVERLDTLIEEVSDSEEGNDTACAKPNIASSRVKHPNASQIQQAGNPMPTRMSGTPASTSTTSRLAAKMLPALPIPLHKLDSLQKALGDIIKEVNHPEMWGVELKPEDMFHTPTRLILAKFLQSNKNNVDDATKHLRKVLFWRRAMKPRELIDSVRSSVEFAGMGYVFEHLGLEGRVVTAFNLYGPVNNEMLSPESIEEFIKWRVALMEMSIDCLKLDTAKRMSTWKVVEAFRMIQVHDFTGMEPSLWTTWNALHESVMRSFMDNYPCLVSKTYVSGRASKLDFSLRVWACLPRDTYKAVSFVESRHQMASELPHIAGEWPREFSMNLSGPSVCEGLTPELDFAEYDAFEIPDDRSDGFDIPKIKITPPSFIFEYDLRTRRQSSESARTLYQEEGVCERRSTEVEDIESHHAVEARHDVVLQSPSFPVSDPQSAVVVNPEEESRDKGKAVESRTSSEHHSTTFGIGGW